MKYKRNIYVSLLVIFTLILTGKTNIKAKEEVFKIEKVIEYKEFNIPQYRFAEDVIKNAKVMQYKNFRIVQPENIIPGKQILNYEQMADAFQKLPIELTKYVNEIQLLDFNSKMDEYWEETYKMKDFKSYAVGDDKQIYFYANDKVKTNNTYFKNALVHEIAHNLDVCISSKENRYSNSTEWILIMSDDLDIKDNGFGLYCSQYAKSASSSTEDFAEAVTQYVLDKENFTINYPNRTLKLNELLN